MYTIYPGLKAVPHRPSQNVLIWILSENSKKSFPLDDDATGISALKWKDLDGNCFAMLQKKKTSGGGRRFGRNVTEEVTEAAAPAESTTVADR